MLRALLRVPNAVGESSQPEWVRCRAAMLGLYTVTRGDLAGKCAQVSLVEVNFRADGECEIIHEGHYFLLISSAIQFYFCLFTFSDVVERKDVS